MEAKKTTTVTEDPRATDKTLIDLAREQRTNIPRCRVGHRKQIRMLQKKLELAKISLAEAERLQQEIFVLRYEVQRLREQLTKRRWWPW